MIHSCRKTDFALVVGALLILWGPGLTASGRSETVPTASVEPVPPAPKVSQCCVDRFPEPAEEGSRAHLESWQVKITGYSSSVVETDDSPGLTATNTPARQGVIALSQDLLREFTPGAPFGFHDRVEIPGLGIFLVEDTMHPRWTHRADVWFATREDAIGWGVRTRKVYRLPEDGFAAPPLPAPGVMAENFGSASFR